MLTFSCNFAALPAMLGGLCTCASSGVVTSPARPSWQRRRRLLRVGDRCTTHTCGLSTSRGVLCLYCKDSGEQVGLASQAFSFARRKFQKSRDLRSLAEDLREAVVHPICEEEQSLGGFFGLEFCIPHPTVCFALHSFHEVIMSTCLTSFIWNIKNDTYFPSSI